MRYVPIIADKRGEMSALAELGGVAPAVMPLICIRNPEREKRSKSDKRPQKPPEEQIKSRLTDPNYGLVGCWGVDAQVMVDPGQLSESHGDTDLVQCCYGWCETMGVKAVPVTGSERPDSERRSTASAVRRLGEGAAIRLQGNEIGRGNSGLTPLLRELDLPRGAVDLIVDLGDLRTKSDDGFLWSRIAKEVLVQLAPLTPWRSVTVAAGSFPDNLSGFVEYENSDYISRLEVDVFARLQAALDSPLTFADYTVSDPAMRVGFRGAANLRFALPDRWLVHRGPHKDEASSGDYVELAADLVGSQLWPAGQSQHCPGCSFIAAKATKAAGSGNGAQWRQAMVAHHLQLTTEQLAA